jgi:hypothetical protein
MTTNLDAARAKWPGDVASLPASFQAVFQTWMGLRVHEMQSTPGAPPAPARGTYPKAMRARDCTLSRTPFPVGTPDPPALLTEAQIISFGGNGSSGDSGSDGGGELAELQRLVQDQQISIQRLLRQQEALADDKDATSSYEVCAATLAKMPESFRASEPMSKADRRHLRRDHGGFYPKDGLPKDLQLPEEVKNEKNVAATKISLVSLTKDIISPLMDGNMDCLRMVGTAHSRVIELHAEMVEAVDSDADAVVLASDVRNELEMAVGAVTAAMDLVLDLHARMRTIVTSRVERAMGFTDLHDDPNKRSKETFLSQDFQEKIEAKAKEKAHMAWAKSGTGGPPRGSLHGQPPQKSGGGGFKQQQRTPARVGGGRGTGRGGGSSKGSGRGSGGKGGGRGNGSSDPPAIK